MQNSVRCSHASALNIACPGVPHLTMLVLDAWEARISRHMEVLVWFIDVTAELQSVLC
ncbi:hypothetical protein AB4Y42_08750 [Paraburkholderia sp. EG286B]|uniref:hypothetical protein n=1 Tax=Paraburkholderia sp. EG286B TaxID=3237011 RepID=UPI0034D34A98